MLPVWNALPEQARGEFITTAPKEKLRGLTAVASNGDYKLTTGPTVFFEHGAGFTYSNNHPSYAGSSGKERSIMFCNTNQRVQAANRRTYPNSEHVIVGCPKMDTMPLLEPPKNDRPKVAFSFHWNCMVAPESQTSFYHYERELVRVGNTMKHWEHVGHGHPRFWPTLKPFWERNRFRLMQNFDDVMKTCDVYVADTTSTLYEFAATGRPVIVLNAPWYRRTVNHGIRFWEDIPGIQVNNRTDLIPMIEHVLANDTFAEERARIVEKVYPFIGSSAKRAADAIQSLL